MDGLSQHSGVLGLQPASPPHALHLLGSQHIWHVVPEQAPPNGSHTLSTMQGADTVGNTEHLVPVVTMGSWQQFPVQPTEPHVAPHDIGQHAVQVMSVQMPPKAVHLSGMIGRTHGAGVPALQMAPVVGMVVAQQEACSKAGSLLHSVEVVAQTGHSGEQHTAHASSAQRPPNSSHFVYRTQGANVYAEQTLFFATIGS